MTEEEKPFKAIYTFTFDKQHTMLDFSDRLLKSGLTADFKPAQVPLPALTFANEFLEHILDKGLTSIFKYTMVMEDITGPSMAINQVEAVVSRFVATLMPATRLVIVDPYFYAPNAASDTDQYLMRILGTHAAALEHLYVLTIGNGSMKVPMQTALTAAAPAIQIHHTKTPIFHDRFWLNPDSGAGIVIGTSLSGLGSRIALVDKLSTADARDVLAEVRKLDASI